MQPEWLFRTNTTSDCNTVVDITGYSPCDAFLSNQPEASCGLGVSKHHTAHDDSTSLARVDKLPLYDDKATDRVLYLFYRSFFVHFNVLFKSFRRSGCWLPVWWYYALAGWTWD